MAMNNFFDLLILIVVIHLNCCHGSRVFPPTGASWLDIGPVLLATERWEETCVCEPQVYWDAQHDEFRMYYRGGWGNGSVGIATSKTVSYTHLTLPTNREV